MQQSFLNDIKAHYTVQADHTNTMQTHIPKRFALKNKTLHNVIKHS